eukprot:425477-Rhodomonas_salina.1
MAQKRTVCRIGDPAIGSEAIAKKELAESGECFTWGRIAKSEPLIVRRVQQLLRQSSKYFPISALLWVFLMLPGVYPGPGVPGYQGTQVLKYPGWIPRDRYPGYPVTKGDGRNFQFPSQQDGYPGTGTLYPRVPGYPGRNSYGSRNFC